MMTRLFPCLGRNPLFTLLLYIVTLQLSLHLFCGSVDGLEQELVFSSGSSGSNLHHHQLHQKHSDHHLYDEEISLGDKEAEIKILMVKLVRNGRHYGSNEASSVKFSTLPQVKASIKLMISDISRSRNFGFEIFVKTLKSGQYTHLLLVQDNVSFSEADIARLILAGRPAIVGVTGRTTFPFTPSIIPTGGFPAAAERLRLWRNGTITNTSNPRDRELQRQHDKQLERFLLELETADQPIAVDCAPFFLGLFERSFIESTAFTSGKHLEWAWGLGMDHQLSFWEKRWPLVSPLSSSSSNSQSKDKVEQGNFFFSADLLHDEDDPGLFGSPKDWSMVEQELDDHIPSSSLQLKADELIQHLFQGLHDEDLTFCSNIVETKGQQLFVHPLVRYGLIVPVELRWPSSSKIGRWLKPLIPEAAVDSIVVENRLADLISGRREHFFSGQSVAPTARVVVATAMWDSVDPATETSLWKLSQRPEVIGRVTIQGHSITDARNKLVRAAEEQFESVGGYTHLLFVDSDMNFNTNDFERLLEADRDIILGLAIKRNEDDFSPAFLPLSGNATDFSDLLGALTDPKLRPFAIRAGGMAFTLIKRQVFEKIQRLVPVPREQDQATLQPLREYFWSIHFGNPSDMATVEHLTEDYTFCYSARLQGFEIFLHPGVQLGHVGSRVYKVQDWLSKQGFEFEEISS